MSGGDRGVYIRGHYGFQVFDVVDFGWSPRVLSASLFQVNEHRTDKAFIGGRKNIARLQIWVLSHWRYMGVKQRERDLSCPLELIFEFSISLAWIGVLQNVC